MAKVKITRKGIEGDADAVSKIIEQQHGDVLSLIGAQKAVPRHTATCIITGIIVLMAVASLVWIGAVSAPIYKILTLLLFSLCFIITYLVHILRKGHLATSIAAVGTLAITLIALNIRSPQQVVETFEQTAQKHLNP